MYITAIFLGLICLIYVAYPLLKKEVYYLDGFKSFATPEELKSLQQLILKKYIVEESAFSDQVISERTWKSRQEFLARRYIDITRRLDFVTQSSKKK